MKNKKPGRILVARTDRIGDVILSTPVLETLRNNFPSSHIAFMVSPTTREFAEGNPNVDEVIVYDKDAAHRTWIDSVKFARQLAKKKFDIALILHSTNRVNIVTCLAGIPRRIGYARKAGILLTDRFKYVKKEGRKHEIDYSLDLLKPLGVSEFCRNPYIPIKQADRDKVEKLFKEAGLGRSEDFIAINPSASCPSRMWPALSFAKLVDSLASEFKMKIVLIGNKNSANTIKTILTNIKSRVIDFSGKTNLGELAVILKHAKLVISNDSGPVHVSCAVGTPVIAIFGRNEAGLSPVRWGPIGKFDIVLHKEVGCKKCLAHKCKIGFKCLSAIKAEEVVDAAREIQRNIGS